MTYFHGWNGCLTVASSSEKMQKNRKIALIKGDGIGIDVAEAAKAVINQTLEIKQLPKFHYFEIEAGARYYQRTGLDIEPGGEEMAENL